MNYYKDWETEIMGSLYLEQKKGTIINFDFAFNLPLTKKWVDICKKRKLSEEFIGFHKLYDGLKIEWSATNQTGGEIQFLEMKYVLQDWKNILYEEADLLENDLLEFYKPFCQISETFSCGFLTTPNFVAESIYYHNAPETELYALDLDFNGFLKMANASKIYRYWPKVIWNLKSKTESPELKALKRDLIMIFSEFNWAEYVKLYQSIRLSNQNGELE